MSAFPEKERRRSPREIPHAPHQRPIRGTTATNGPVQRAERRRRVNDIKNVIRGCQGSGARARALTFASAPAVIRHQVFGPRLNATLADPALLNPR